MRNILLKSRKIWLTSVLAWCKEQQQQHPMPETENIQSSSINILKKIHDETFAYDSEIKTTLQMRLFMIFMFYMMLWKTLHMI